MSGSLWQTEESSHNSTYPGISQWSRVVLVGHKCQWFRSWGRSLTRTRWGKTCNCILQPSVIREWMQLLCYKEGTSGCCVGGQTLPSLPVGTIFHGAQWPWLSEVAHELQKSWGTVMAMVASPQWIWLWDPVLSWSTAQECWWPVEKIMSRVPALWTTRVKGQCWWHRLSRPSDSCDQFWRRHLRWEMGSTWSDDQLQAWQREDPIVAKVVDWVQNGEKPQWKDVRMEGTTIRTYWFNFEQLELINHILYRKIDKGGQTSHRLVAPQTIRGQIFDFLHAKCTGGHLGISRTSASAPKRFWWPGMKKDVMLWCRQCNRCQLRNLHPGPRRSQLHQESVGQPMECISFDILSFPDMTTEGNTCVLVICHYFTKWVEAFALVDHRASTVADVLVTKVFLRFGVPRYIHSDQAPEFMSELKTELCQLLEVQHTRTCPYHPQSDGLVERFNRTLINMLSKFCCERKDDWDQHLPLLLCAYRATVNESTGCSPNLLMLGRETTMPIDLMYPSPQYSPYRCHVEYIAWVKSALEDNFERARQQLGVVAERQKRNYDVRTKDRHFQVGDFVLWFYPPNLEKTNLAPHILDLIE